MRKIALVGAGYISHIQAEALRTIPNVQLQAVVDLLQNFDRYAKEKNQLTIAPPAAAGEGNPAEAGSNDNNEESESNETNQNDTKQNDTNEDNANEDG